MKPKDIIRFMNKVKIVGSCWEWQGAKNQLGYGMFRLNGKNIIIHRLSYELFKEDIPQGLEIDHLCRNRACVNPSHLEAVTHQENCKRGIALHGFRVKITHCPQGHEYTKENTKFYKNSRSCRICHRMKCTIYRNKTKKLQLIKFLDNG